MRDSPSRLAADHGWSSDSIRTLANDRRFQFLSLMVFALVLNREGDRVPTGNEFVYLLYFWKGWHPQFLATDWTFQETTAGHAVFSYGLGWMAKLLPLTLATWVGRFCCWTGVFLGLLRVGRHFKIQSWAVWAGVLLWLAEGQSLVTTEWMVGTFEAKAVAYTCLLFAIDAVLAEKFVWGGILCGIAFSFHSAVGMWAGAALGLAVLTSSSIRQTIQFAVAVIIFSLPGLLTSLQMILGKHAISAADAKFLIVTSLPSCLDPFFFDKTSVVILAVIPFFAAMYARRVWDDRPQRMLFTFEIALATFFFLGVAARVMGWFNFVLLYPLRVYAVFAMLLFFWQVASLIPGMAIPGNNRKPSVLLMAFAIVLFLALPSPVLQLANMITSRIPHLHHPVDSTASTSTSDNADFQLAAKWIATHTPETDVVIAPPWQNDGYYYIRRPLIANWHAPRYDELSEWKQRIESLVGDISHTDPAELAEEGMGPTARTHYEQLTPTDIERIRHRYGGNWLLTTSRYSYPVAFASGEYSVYRLP